MSDTSPEPRFLTCRCRHCDAGIEFDDRNAEQAVECPSCHLETVLFVPSVATHPVCPAEKPPPIVVWFGNISSRLHLKTTSGAEFELVALRLFNAKDLQTLANRKALAVQKMGGVSTGLGAIGSMSSVLITAGVIGTLESLLSAGAAKTGEKIIQDVLRLETQLRTQGLFFPVGMIDEIMNPAPHLWHVPPQPEYPSGFIHSGDEFIAAKDSEGRIQQIRWSSVEHYSYQANK